MHRRFIYECSVRGLCFLSLVLLAAPVLAGVTNPARVDNLLVDISGADLVLQWDPVTVDVTGNPESISHYDIYRGLDPQFVPDKAGGSNRVGTSPTESFTDPGAGGAGSPSYYYLIVAVDLSGNQGAPRPSTITTPATLTGYWTDTTVELDWTAAQPAGEVLAYKLYRGRSAGSYEYSEDVSLSQVYSAIGLETDVNWHFAVTAIDAAGNETAFSNEHTDPVGGTLVLRAHDEIELCWGGATCTPTDPTHVQRSDGFQVLVPADFPAGDWTRVEVTFTMDSRLCNPPADGNVTKCGSGNPCPEPPCNGGYNTCGDPWDRTAHLFMVLDDCIEGGHGCMNHDNIELMRAVTPFGTDADPPDGTGAVPPRALTLDITPFVPLLAGQTRYIGAHITHYTQGGWWVSSEFRLSKRPEETSPKPPADGIDPVFFHNSGAALTGPFAVDLPVEAQDIFGRLFITGHGGNADPTCVNPADEFCQRENRILVNSNPAWTDIPWRDCCYPRGSAQCLGCTDWNACGYPSCTYDRSGWCPGEIACHDNLDEGCDQDLNLSGRMSGGQSHDIEYEVVDVNGSWSRSLVVYWYQDLQGFCGNDVREPGEACDGVDLGGQTCQSQGFDTGTLFCQSDCQGFDTSACTTFQCGNNICEPGGGEDCLSCPGDCNGVQGGNPGNRYCCGDGDGDTPVGCSDPRCTANGNSCQP